MRYVTMTESAARRQDFGVTAGEDAGGTYRQLFIETGAKQIESGLDQHS